MDALTATADFSIRLDISYIRLFIICINWDPKFYQIKLDSLPDNRAWTPNGSSLFTEYNMRSMDLKMYSSKVQMESLIDCLGRRANQKHGQVKNFTWTFLNFMIIAYYKRSLFCLKSYNFYAKCISKWSLLVKRVE